MSTIVLDTLRAKRQEVNEEYEAKLRNLEERKHDLKKFEARVMEVQDMIHELDDAIQRETEAHFEAKPPANDLPF